MAHFAKIGINGKVIDVIKVSNEVILDSNRNESEINGIDFLTKLTGWSIWKQTSYNRNFRKNFAGVGYTYDEDKDAFIPKKPFNSWVLNETTCLWNAPVVKPDDGQDYIWNETIQNWELVE
jgi:hypothetical protein